MDLSKNRICKLLSIDRPIIQAGMVWCSGWRLASAVSRAGGLGLIGSGSMYPEVLREHIRKCRGATAGAFGVNVPLIYPDIDKVMQVLREEKVSIAFTSAGNPATWTKYLKDAGMKVVHVVSSAKFARKAEEAGADAVVAEGFEAGGHNGREETTTMVLIPLVKDAVSIPVIAAGGIWDGRSMLAAEALGAEGVQIGTRFAASKESSAHPNFKARITNAAEGDTLLTLKQLTPVRMIKNEFFSAVQAAESRGATAEELKELLGARRAKRGIFEGDLAEGELEIGQVCAAIKRIQPAAEILDQIWIEYSTLRKSFCS